MLLLAATTTTMFTWRDQVAQDREVIDMNQSPQSVDPLASVEPEGFRYRSNDPEEGWGGWIACTKNDAETLSHPSRKDCYEVQGTLSFDTVRRLLSEQEKRLSERIDELEDRLEIKWVYDGDGNKIPMGDSRKHLDGIFCRDETIRMLEERLASPAVVLPDDIDYLQIARDTGLRGFMFAVPPTQARELLWKYVAAILEQTEKKS